MPVNNMRADSNYNNARVDFSFFDGSDFNEKAVSAKDFSLHERQIFAVQLSVILSQHLDVIFCPQS